MALVTVSRGGANEAAGCGGRLQCSRGPRVRPIVGVHGWHGVGRRDLGLHLR